LGKNYEKSELTKMNGGWRFTRVEIMLIEFPAGIIVSQQQIPLQM